MIVKIQGEDFEFDAGTASAEEILGRVNAELEKTNQLVGSMVIDGVEVFNNHLAYINEKIESIRDIEVKPATKHEIAMENVDLIGRYMESAIPSLSKVAEDFRTGVTEEGWLLFESIVKGLIFIEGLNGDILGMLLSYDNKEVIRIWGKVIEEYRKLNDMLKDLEEFLDHDQTEQAADMVEYKMKPILERVLSLIGEI